MTETTVRRVVIAHEPEEFPYRAQFVAGQRVGWFIVRAPNKHAAEVLAAQRLSEGETLAEVGLAW